VIFQSKIFRHLIEIRLDSLDPSQFLQIKNKVEWKSPNRIPNTSLVRTVALLYIRTLKVIFENLNSVYMFLLGFSVIN
jgi:hypothetical protein